MLETERLRRIRDELGHRPWHELKIDELAHAAGLSRMTLHRRGVAKEDIAHGLRRLLAEEHAASALPALTASGPADERLGMALRAACAVEERYLGIIEGLGDRINDVFHEPGEGEVLTRPVFTDAIRRILEDGAADGTLRELDDPVETATLLFNAAGWTYRHMRTGHRWGVERASEQLADLLVAGVRA
jgi:AcrR family transcriptional regulator